MARRRRLGRAAVFAAAIGLALPLLVASPAQAASCWNVGTDGTYASAMCSGPGQARLVVRCHAIWPFSPWTDYGSWVTIGGSATIVNPHAYCAAPVTVQPQYR